MFKRWLPPSLNYLADAGILVIIAGVGTFIGYAFISRDFPVVVLERHLLSLTPNPLMGETFDYETFFIRTKWCEAKVNRWFVDSSGANVHIDPLPYSMRTDGLFYPQSQKTSIKLPITLTSGPTEWCFRPEWKCNWTQRLPWPGPILGPQECITFWVNNPLKPWPELQP